MTHQLEAAAGRAVAVRWCTLAEQRLEYLTELFETGRWRRFYTELSFLENIQEAKTAVDLWRDLSSREPVRAVRVSWIERPGSSPPHGATLIHHADPQRQPAEVRREPAAAPLSIVPQAGSLGSEQVFAAPVLQAGSELASSMDSIADRYPVLRNAL